MYKLVKRSLDFIVSLIVIILLLPFILPLSIVLRFTAEGEIFYLQERMGFKNRKFKIFKFATMLKNSLNLGTGSITLKGDFRVTRIGKYLRKTKIVYYKFRPFDCIKRVLIKLDLQKLLK